MKREYSLYERVMFAVYLAAFIVLFIDIFIWRK